MRRARLAAGIALWIPLAFSLHCAPQSAEDQERRALLEPADDAAPVLTEPRAPPSQATLLEPGASLGKELRSGETHHYRLHLPAGHYVRLAADSRNVDLELILTEPEGKPFSARKLAAERWRLEPLSAVPESAGAWSLVINGQGPGGSAGTYRLDFEELRPATDADYIRVDAEQAHARGFELVLDDEEQALEHFQAALRLWQEAADPASEARTRHWLGMVQTNIDLDAAAESFHRALALRRQHGDRTGEADALHGLGVVESDRDQYDNAVDLLGQALSLYQQLDDREPAAHALIQLGYALKRQTDFQAALDRYQRALELFRALEDRTWQAVALLNIGSILQDLGEIDPARGYFEDVLAISRQLNDRDTVAATLNNIGWGLKAQQKPALALPYFQEALAIVEDLGMDRARAAILDNIGRAYLDLGEPRETLRYSGEAYQLDRGRPRGQAVRLNSLGMAYHALGEHSEAVMRFEQALGISRRIGNRKNEVVALHGLARLHREMATFEAAQEHAAAALEGIEGIRRSLESPDHQASYLAARHAHYEFEIDLLVEAAREQPARVAEYLGAALTIHERATARSLLEGLAKLVDARSGADPTLLARERELFSQLNELEWQRLALEVGRPGNKLARIRRQTRELRLEIDGIKRNIRASSPLYDALAPPEPLSFEEIQQQLDGDSVLLEYALGDPRSHVFRVTVDDIEVFVLPSRSEIEQAARQFGKLVARPGSDPAEVAQAAARLGEMVLVPLAGRLGDLRLLLVTDGALQYVPFAALPIPGDASGRQLVLEHEIVHLPSVSVLAEMRRRVAGRERAPGIVAVLADPVLTPSDARLLPETVAQSAGDNRVSAIARSAADLGLLTFERLKSSGHEARSIIELLPPDEHFAELVGFAASRATATSPEMAGYRTLHFATHGVLNDRHPELSGLVLSLYDEQGDPQDGFLRLHDVVNLKLNADLVVLSACQTARGKEVRGEGLISLTRGFMYAGAERVVASLWQVDDEATAELMRRFYRGLLREGLGPPAALRAAQVEMIRDDQIGSDPFFWAPFILQGEWR